MSEIRFRQRTDASFTCAQKHCDNLPTKYIEVEMFGGVPVTICFCDNHAKQIEINIKGAL